MKGTKVQSKTEQEKADDFIKEFNALCEKHQMQIISQPTFVARDDGTFSVKLISSVGKLPKPVEPEKV